VIYIFFSYKKLLKAYIGRIFTGHFLAIYQNNYCSTFKRKYSQYRNLWLKKRFLKWNKGMCARKPLIGFQHQSRIAAATISEENITKKKMSCSKIDRQ